MATFTYIPSQAPQLNQQTRILEATFGDGYVQAMEEGINANPKKWKLNFENISNTSANAIILFFTSNKTATIPFDWTDPDAVVGRYKCKMWDKSMDGYEHVSVSCEFEQVFW